MSSTLAARALRRLGTYRLGRLCHSNPALVSWPGGAVSFSFDDFPRSALTVGGAILERHGVRGTYYAALGLAGSDGVLGPLFEREDAVAARRRGHEIACHTFRHLNCRDAAAAAILADVADNAAACAGLLDGYVPVNFAYPYGDLSLMARRALAPRFWSCRGITQGFNAGWTDFAELRATRIHAEGFDAVALRRLIERNRAAGGWLVFYTHDVAVAPSPHGCTPDQFEAVVALAVEGSAAVLPVRAAVERLRSAGAAPAVGRRRG